jgi:PAS domain S-box-containing protein
MYFYFYQIFMIVSLVLSLVVIGLAWRRRSSPGAGAMIALAAAIFVWTLGFYLEASSDTLERQLFFNNVGYAGSMAVPVAWFVFALNYSHSRKLIRGWKTGFYCVIPFVIVILVWTNSLHHLMWSNEHLIASGPFQVTAKTYGPVFWIALAHNYFYILFGGIVLFRRLFFSPRLYAGQAVSLIIGVCLPWVWNIIYVFNLISLPRKDLTPAMFAVSGIALALGLLRFRLFTSIPFAREFIIQQLHDGVLVFDGNNYIAEANPAALKIVGLDEKIIGKKLGSGIFPSDIFKYLSSAKLEREEISLSVAGEWRYYEIEKSKIMNYRGRQVGWIAIFHDITGRKQAEEKYKLITEHSADVIYKYNIKDDIYNYVSPSVERLFGYTEKEAMQLNPSRTLTPESYERQLGELIKDIQRGVSENILQLEAVHKDGHTFPVEIHGKFVFDDKGQPVEVVGVVRDITERKRMEEQIIMQDRLASVGQLTSGLAHELNNPLTSVINYSSLLLDRELPEDVKQDISVIRDEARRTADIVKSLIAFTRKQPLEKRSLNLNGCINKVLALRSYEQKINNIKVITTLNPALPLIYGNDSQLQQVFFDIIINAEYFMLQAHGGGTLNIVTIKAGDYVRISIADDGPGISKEDINKIFAPFFTTKDQGTGTGLSLNICQGMISEHQGGLWVESEPGKGATFFIELPVYKEDFKEDDK